MTDCILTRRGDVTVPMENFWFTGAEAPISKTRRTAQLYNGKIYCPLDSSPEIQIYDIANNSWGTGASASHSIYRYTSQLYDGKIYCPIS